MTRGTRSHNSLWNVKPIDREALQLAIEIARRDPLCAEQIESKLRHEPWQEVAKFAVAFRGYGLVSVCGIWARNAHSGSLSPRAGFGVSFLMGMLNGERR